MGFGKFLLLLLLLLTNESQGSGHFQEEQKKNLKTLSRIGRAVGD